MEENACRPEIYLPCSECKAWLCEKSLSNHAKTCPAGKPIDTNYLRNSRMLITPFISLDSDDDDIENLILQMRETTQNPGLRNICMQDILIKEFCRGLLHRLGTEDEQRPKDKNNVSTKLRAVARLLSKLNEKTKDDCHLSSYITPKYFMLVVNAVRDMGKHSPNLALTLGHYIKQVCQLKQSLALRNEAKQDRDDAAAFNLLYEAHWNSYVAAISLRRLKLRTLNKSIELPKTSDMVKLKDYLDSEMEQSLTKNQFSDTEWTEAAQALMVRILLFNKRRVSEVGEIKVSDIEQAQNCSDNEQVMSQMDIAEKALASRMVAIEVRGKSTRGLRKVFVVLSQPMLSLCQHLIQKRMYVGIPPSNAYLFTRPSGSVLDGCQAMREVTSRCPGLECPELIRTRLLRKYLATTIQLLDMKGNELQMIADHMGHSVSIHTDVYRLQSSMLERTKVARALVALENGQLGKFAGRNLASCTFEELPIPIVDPASEEFSVSIVDQNSEQLQTNDALAVTFEDRADSGEDSENEDLRENGKTSLKRAHTMVSQESENKDLSTVKKRFHSRKRWDETEEACLLAEFKEHIASKSNPSALDIKRAQAIHPCLKDRSIAVIKSKVSNIILGKCKLKLSN